MLIRNWINFFYSSFFLSNSFVSFSLYFVFVFFYQQFLDTAQEKLHDTGRIQYRLGLVIYSFSCLESFSSNYESPKLMIIVGTYAEISTLRGIFLFSTQDSIITDQNFAIRKVKQYYWVSLKVTRLIFKFVLALLKCIQTDVLW